MAEAFRRERYSVATGKLSAEKDASRWIPNAADDAGSRWMWPPSSSPSPRTIGGRGTGTKTSQQIGNASRRGLFRWDA
ncbi:hypothetical protein [Amycolatopsis sp. lyj-112]|uniref:hypothetical protein n=1 Tax=Amycolatopsis sp. lyj-112 TaxID=2789288 RepID=UPI00397DE095